MATASSHTAVTGKEVVGSGGEEERALTADALASIQQVYNPPDRYILTAQVLSDEIRMTALIRKPLGLEVPLSYAPASTIGALLSQACAVQAWIWWAESAEDPHVEFGGMCAREEFGWRRERICYHSRLPIGRSFDLILHSGRCRGRGGYHIADIEVVAPRYFEFFVHAFRREVRECARMPT